MPATIHKIDSSAAVHSDVSRQLHLVHRKVIPFAPETRFLPERRPGETPYCRRHEVVTALLLTAGLHLTGFALLQGGAQERALTEPAPIQVAWIASPHPHAESTPASPGKLQKPRKPAQKPKPGAAKRIKAKPKALLSSSAAVPAASTVPSESAEKTATLAAAAPPGANTVQPAASASSPENADSRQPLVQPNLNADYLNNPPPHYPEEARERGEEGKVLIKSLINADGTVAELAIKKSSGFPDLDRSALETVKKWRFVPARRGDTKVSAWVVVPVSFTLEG